MDTHDLSQMDRLTCGLTRYCRPMCLLLAVLVLLGCTQSAAPGRGDGGSTPNRGAGQSVKTLVVGVQREPTDLGVLFGQGTATTAGGAGSVKLLVHDRLAVEMELDRWEAQLAVKLPSIEDGSWRVNPDGSMDTTWQLRPNIRWHDGTSFTSDDLMFAFRIFMDPDLATTGGTAKKLMESASAPDARTFVIHWSGTYVDAPQGSMGVMRPKHILEELYLRDKEAFTNSPWFTTEFVGLGPYRLANWQLGSHMELVRFDDYYQGRPKLDRIIVRFVGDPNALVAGILAGELDVVLPVTVDLDAALDLKRRWEGTGNQVQVDVTGQLPQLEMQYREVARPRNGFANPAVRQAFYQAIDRQTLTDVMTQGLAPVADSWFPPSHVQRRQVESAIPQYAYDLVRAQALLAQAGWTRAPDGSLVSAQTGERFETELWGLTGQSFALERQLSIIADGWKGLGVHVDFGAIPPARLREAQYVAEHPGPLFTSFAARQFSVDRLYSEAIPSAANRWSGFNRGGYSNPAVDELFERLTVTIDEGQRIAIMRQMLQEAMGNVVLMPLYWEVVPTLMVRGVSGPKHVGTDTTRNIFQWDKS
jgi:peptide/nickel transport system substrate-binding protein